ncbi:methyltransferase domain-containing protein [Candidatus Bipolaricaulota bacterium]|nr:methyltransferase domain-containing protein [Candidatus Bipolaricaulota bacterium]
MSRSDHEGSMDWVSTFYKKQHLWGNVYSGAIERWHRDKAESIVLPDRQSPYRILELGCGGGQEAIALAELGHTVVAIDMNTDAILNARRLAASKPDCRVTLVEGDFYAFNPAEPFDIVCYFDGFGIGTDEDQQQLLHRMASWLGTEGRAFIEVYTPWYWSRVAGILMEWPDVSRRYSYDAARSRMLDTWWPTGTPDEAVTQSLRCYSVDDLESLLDGTGLRLTGVQPEGSYDHETKIFHPSSPMKEAMQYMAFLEKDRS